MNVQLSFLLCLLLSSRDQSMILNLWYFRLLFCFYTFHTVVDFYVYQSVSVLLCWAKEQSPILVAICYCKISYSLLYFNQCHYCQYIHKMLLILRNTQVLLLEMYLYDFLSSVKHKRRHLEIYVSVFCDLILSQLYPFNIITYVLHHLFQPKNEITAI